jgi:hypothetical protein
LNAAERLLSASISVRRRIGDEAGITPSLNNLGVLYLGRGDPIALGIRSRRRCNSPTNWTTLGELPV